MENTKKKVDRLAGLFVGWGFKESWAKLLAGAAIGALLALGAFSQTSCTVSLTKLPDGSISLNGSVAQPVTVNK